MKTKAIIAACTGMYFLLQGLMFLQDSIHPSIDLMKSGGQAVVTKKLNLLWSIQPINNHKTMYHA